MIYYGDLEGYVIEFVDIGNNTGSKEILILMIHKTNQIKHHCHIL